MGTTVFEIVPLLNESTAGGSCETDFNLLSIRATVHHYRTSTKVLVLPDRLRLSNNIHTETDHDIRIRSFLFKQNSHYIGLFKVTRLH